MRFRFGRNWRRYLDTLTSERIATAEGSLRDVCGSDTLAGSTFIDVGCGSGLFSLAARRMGARVVSFDYDSDSVACTRQLRARYAPHDTDESGWKVMRGDVLDGPFVASLGPADVVYAFGALHHTGALWAALDAAISLVKAGGILHVALYKDCGFHSRFWLKVKRAFNSSRWAAASISAVYFPWKAAVTGLRSLKRRENMFASYAKDRGMHWFHDQIDWLGGYPFEVSAADDVIRFCRLRGLFVVAFKDLGWQYCYTLVRGARAAERFGRAERAGRIPAAPPADAPTPASAGSAGPPGASLARPPSLTLGGRS